MKHSNMSSISFCAKCGDLPMSLDALKDEWDGPTIRSPARRLLLFAPETYPWNDIFNDFDDTIFCPIDEGGGAAGLDFDVIIDMLSSSI